MTSLRSPRLDALVGCGVFDGAAVSLLVPDDRFDLLDAVDRATAPAT